MRDKNGFQKKKKLFFYFKLLKHNINLNSQTDYKT